MTRDRSLATQTQYRWRTTIRTAVATTVMVLVAVAAVAPAVSVFVGSYLPGYVPKVLAVGVACGGLAALAKTVGTDPAVARLLTQVGLGYVPRSELKEKAPPIPEEGGEQQIASTVTVQESGDTLQAEGVSPDPVPKFTMPSAD